MMPWTFMRSRAREHSSSLSTVIGSDARGVLQGGGGQVAHGIFGSSEHVAPQEFTFGEGFVELCKQVLRGRDGEGGDEARGGLTRVRVVLSQDLLARCAKGRAEVIDHGGDAAGHKVRANGRAKAETATIATEGVLTEALSCPSKEASRS